MISKLTIGFAKTSITSILFTFSVLILTLCSVFDIAVAGERIFNGSTRISINGVARRVFHADIDKDGNMDIINQQMNAQVGLRWGQDDGSYLWSTLYLGDYYESAFAIGDVNGDGYDDIIAGNSTSTRITIAINNQAGGFNGIYRVTTPGFVNGLKITDFDGQHGLDIAFSMSGIDGVGVILSTGIGDSVLASSMIIETLPFSNLSSKNGITTIQDGLSVADVDGINGVDLISMAESPASGYAVIWHNNGDGTFSSPPDTIALYGKPIIITPEDFNQDGYVDLVTTNFSGNATMLLNNNHNGFHPQINLTSDFNGIGFKELHVVDINFDTYPDIISTKSVALNDEYETYIFYNDGTGRFGTNEKFYVGGVYIAIGDLNNDGLYDISGVTAFANGLLISYGDAPGSFFKPGEPIMGEATLITTGDINNDGLVDILTSHNRRYEIYLQNLDGSFSGTLSLDYGNNQHFAALADVNNDNNLDIIGHGGGSKTINLGNGDGTFGQPSFYDVTSQANERYVFCEDFTNDGYKDIILPSINGLLLFVNNQDGSFASEISLNINSEFAKYGDINNDNFPDIIYTQNDTVYVKFNDGTGQFPNDDIALIGVGDTYIADYNNDNLQDIIVSQHIYINNGDSTFTDRLTHALGVSFIIGMQDLDSDEDNDFIAYTSGTFRTYMNNVADTFQAEIYHMNQAIHTGTAADMNNDGLLDVITGYAVDGVNNYFSKEMMYVSYNNGNGLDTDTCLSLFDYDSDGHRDDCDNCPTIANPGQEDSNFDGIGDSCSFSENTIVGGDVDIDFGVVSVSFDSVATGGTTELTVTASGPDAQIGVTLLPFSPSSYYNISTTAFYFGSVSVCVSYDDSELSAVQEDKLSINHFNGTSWEDITAAKDTVNNIICGSTETFSPFAIGITKTPTDVEEIVGRLLPTSITLADNYPNPFNPSTTIEFAIPTNSFVTLKVYNVIGQEVKTLVDQNISAGTFSTTWDSDNNSGGRVASGVYLYKLTVDQNVITKKMILLK